MTLITFGSSKNFARFASIPFILLFAIQAFAADSAGEFLTKELSFSARDISDLRAGKEISRVLDNKDKQEVVVAGAISIAVPKEKIIDAVRDITTFRRSKEVQAIGKFEKYEVAETKSLTLEDSELQSLRKCKAKDCGWKLPASWIDRLTKTGIDATREFRQLITDYARQYSTEGNKAMWRSDQLQLILNRSDYLSAQAPEFLEYLKGSPDQQLSTESFIYWSKEKFGFKPVISLTHLIFYHPNPAEILIGSKQIFANHYFNGSLGLTFLFDNGTKGTYLIYVNRSRIDALDGFLSFVRRGIAIPKIRKGLDTTLKLLRTRFEKQAVK